MEKKDTYTQGFKTPEDYFESFDECLFETILLVENISKENPFSVPLDYFEALEEDIFKNISAAETTRPQPKVISLSNLQKVSIAIAASVVLLLGIQWTLTPTAPTLTSIEINTIEQYLEDDLYDLDSYDLMALLEETPLSLPEIPLELSQEVIESYLLETTDVTELIENEPK